MGIIDTKKLTANIKDKLREECISLFESTRTESLTKEEKDRIRRAIEEWEGPEEHVGRDIKEHKIHDGQLYVNQFIGTYSEYVVEFVSNKVIEMKKKSY